MAKQAHGEALELDIGARTIRVTNPDKVFFPECGLTKLDLVRYYVAVGEAALRGVADRPIVLKRYPDGAAGEPFFQKRVPAGRPPWVKTVVVRFPSGRSAEEVCPDDVAHLAWIATLGCIDLNPWPVRRSDLDHPDELRVDLDPAGSAGFDAVRRVALETRVVLGQHGLVGFPKTSGSKGMHVIVPIRPRYDFTTVRRAALALARELERRLPEVATSAWWKKERGDRVLVDYNQNARDRTVASVYSVRAVPDARVSYPLEWGEVPDVDPAAFTVRSVPARLSERGDPFATLHDSRYGLEGLLELATRDEAGGLGDAPWPPHFAKGAGELRRASPRRHPGA